MWTEKRKNGVLYCERYEHPLTGKKFKVSVLMDKETAANKRLANEILLKKRDEKLGAAATVSKVDELTLNELVELYRIDQKRTVKPSTYKRNYYACQSLMDIIGKDVYISRLTAGYVKQMLTSQNEENGTINERIKRMKALFRWAYFNDYIEDIKWLDKIQLYPDAVKKSKIENKFYEKSELSQLLDGMDVQQWRYVAEFSALTGMRIGEVIALKRTDINLKDKTIWIHANRDYNNQITGTTKTDSSTRVISIQAQLENLIRQINIFEMRKQLQFCYKTDLFFSNDDGGYINYYSYNKYLRENSMKILNKQASTHIMRHTHVALLAENGVPLDVISRRLGHSDSTVTREVYFHVTKKLAEKDAKMLNLINII